MEERRPAYVLEAIKLALNSVDPLIEQASSIAQRVLGLFVGLGRTND